MRPKKLTYYSKKCLIFLISVFILSVAVFYVARLAPGDPLISYYGDRTEKMSPEEREWAMEKLGLNEPISTQYVKWVKNAFHGEFGISFKYKQDVVEVIGGRIGNTLLLGGVGFLFIFNFRFRKPTNKELVILVSVVAVAVFFILFYKEAWWARHGVVTKLKGVAP